MIFGKKFQARIPAAMLCREEVACFAPGDQGGTYTGHALMTAVGLAVTQAILAPGFLESVQKKGRILPSA